MLLKIVLLASNGWTGSPLGSGWIAPRRMERARSSLLDVRAARNLLGREEESEPMGAMVSASSSSFLLAHANNIVTWFY